MELFVILTIVAVVLFIGWYPFRARQGGCSFPPVRTPPCPGLPIGGRMLYTVGHRENYLRAISESPNGIIQKTGKHAGYGGGIVFKSYEDASRFMNKDSTPKTWCIWGLIANWETDTEPDPHPEAWWHVLLTNSDIVKIEST